MKSDSGGPGDHGGLIKNVWRKKNVNFVWYMSGIATDCPGMSHVPYLTLGTTYLIIR